MHGFTAVWAWHFPTDNLLCYSAIVALPAGATRRRPLTLRNDSFRKESAIDERKSRIGCDDSNLDALAVARRPGDAPRRGGHAPGGQRRYLDGRRRAYAQDVSLLSSGGRVC